MAFDDLKSHRSWVAFFRIRCFIVSSVKYDSFFSISFSFGADAISAVGVAYDYEAFCFSGAKSADELAFNAGYVGVEGDF